VFGLSRSQAWGWASPGVLVPLIISACAAAAFLLVERAVASPLLNLNLQMSPALAGLALIPTTLPMVFLAPLAGRWYDRAGGRPPLVAGFAVLLASGLLLAWGVHGHAYLPELPGLLLYGTGLALILTVNDPVSIDTVPARDHGQASGVSATAELFGGAVGIAVLYLIFHATYLNQLQAKIAASPLSAMTQQQGQQFKDALATAESTGS
jgi:MFS family permease